MEKNRFMELLNVRIKRILYATDLSENAVHALAYAVSVANAYAAGITTLHVLSEFSGEEFVTNMISSDTLAEIKQRHYSEAKNQLIGKQRDKTAIREILRAFYAESVTSGEIPEEVADEVLIRSGLPAEVIMQTAQDLKCDLIVMGNHGQGLLADVLIGSTAKRVVKHSSIPVLLVRLP
jgi:nucleotide-binding universal stress UspA family protein